MNQYQPMEGKEVDDSFFFFVGFFFFFFFFFFEGGFYKFTCAHLFVPRFFTPGAFDFFFLGTHGGHIG